MGVQSAWLLQEDFHSPFAAVYTSAGAANQKYVGCLGADHVFDYEDPQVVDVDVSAGNKNGLVTWHCFLAMGQLARCQALLKAFFGHVDHNTDNYKERSRRRRGIPSGSDEVDGVEIIFVMLSMDKGERLAHFRYQLGTWGREKLANGDIRPSPEPRVVGRGSGRCQCWTKCATPWVSCTNWELKLRVRNSGRLVPG